MGIKIQRLSVLASPFAGISFVNELFNGSGLRRLIGKEVGLIVKAKGYHYSDFKNYKKIRIVV